MNTDAEQYLIQNSILSQKLNKKLDLKLSLHGISFTEYLIIHNLNQAQKNTLRRIELAEIIGITASGITRLLAPMEKIGLVEKEINPRDARVSLVKLTATGKRFLRDAKKTFSETAGELTSNLSEYDLNRLLQLNAQLT